MSHKLIEHTNRDYEDLQLDNRIIVLTGAYGSLGTVIAHDLARRGAQLILIGRRAQPLQHLAESIEELGFGKHLYITLDYRKLNQTTLTDCIDTIAQHHQHIDGLIHTAATLGLLTSVTHYPLELWQDVQQVNCTGLIQLTQGLLPLMHASAQARIVITGSDFNQDKLAYWGAFATSQASLQQFFQLLSIELAHTHIKLHQILPSNIQSKLRAQALPAEDNTHLLEPKAIAPLYAHLVSARNTHQCGSQHQLVNNS